MSFRDLDRPPLDAGALRAALRSRGSFWTDVVVTSTTGSTNADVVAAARAGAPEGTVHTTDVQTSGRGRLDRRWESPAGAGITVSVLLRPDGVPAARWVWLPLLVGLAVDATAHEVGVASGLKWPNDVLVDGRKLAGILLERVETPTGPAAVVGVGLNVTLRRTELPVETATSLALEGATETDRAVVLRVLLRNLEALYRAWHASGGDPERGIRESYERRCVTLGTPVRVSMPDGSTLEGQATGIDDLGRLLVDGVAVSAGDITHVRPAT
jgi:BirA family biotin operon repressor/biotin-[acetyl-CoA-carboxylase] ligase